MENIKKKAAIYVRVSTGKQDNSIKAQTDRIADYSTYQKIAIQFALKDEDVSGGMPLYQRPEGKKIKQLIESKQINCVVVTKIDRLFRSTIDALTTVDEWNKKDIALMVIDMGGQSVDTSTAAGRMVFIMLVAFSEFERGRTSERTRDVLSHKKKNLKPYSSAVYGYKVEGREVSPEGKVISPGTLVKDTWQQQVIAIMKKLKGEGESLRAIAEHLNKEEIKPIKGKFWSHSTIAQILENEIHND